MDQRGPCKECANSGCGPFHDQCEKYQEFVKNKSEINRKAKNYQLDHLPLKTTYGKKSYWRNNHGVFKSGKR